MGVPGARYWPTSTERMPILVDQHDPIRVVNRDNSHRTEMLHHLSPFHVATGHGHVVRPQGDHMATVDLFTRNDIELIVTRLSDLARRYRGSAGDASEVVP